MKAYVVIGGEDREVDSVWLDPILADIRLGNLQADRPRWYWWVHIFEVSTPRGRLRY